MHSFFKEKPLTVDVEQLSLSKNKKLKVISLFSGCGGMDLGFKGGFNYLNKNYEENPFELIYSNDIFKQASQVYEHNFQHKVDTRNIETIDKIEFPHADVVLGGFPCQTFSLAGKREGLSSDRGQLYKQMIKVIKSANPKVFIAENVDGIRSSKKDEKLDKSALDIILDDFNDLGYSVQYQVLNASFYGVPQSRKRVIIIGIRNDLKTDIYFPKESHNLNNWKTAKDAIDDIWNEIGNPKIMNHSISDYSKAKFYPGKKMQGNNKINADKPSPTIRAEHHGNIEAHYRTTNSDTTDMSGWRRLSVRECARLQSFPDNFNFNVSASSAYKMIGNAVPPVMAWHIARSVYYSLDKKD
ncbi:DNA cytosine methyltransferase [Brochothrix thermosphacta]|uniref:DNA cytosine methyltransferase n=1 Tax=Brochothrix thermosphacta TaxID=2756 RepID=UPI00083F5E51|nr:DNA cytosine methyltransferase [Brochothrix thermosphacta]ODJ61031.1 DNA (cytosine-5-)-methyltransferase [Brochothrix thermosphacta]ODJ62557.1 DNA (cytosine-5-)-methyltransferase [Brochothrix thermosphacta]SPN72091.1 putative C-5 cytosine methyltransferase [Brochothrix thermosphacta]